MSQVSEFSHLPVLFTPCMENLRILPNGIYVDCTAGGGGHSKGIFERLGPGGRLIIHDKDDEALDACAKTRANAIGFAEWSIVKSDFGSISSVLEDLSIDRVDGILADLGVSSHQLDTADRGFSYVSDGPLDMRMDTEQAVSARTVVNSYSEDQLVSIFRSYGEERYSGRIATAIANERRIHPIETTTQLAAIISRAMPAKAKKEDQHPARRCFQAIRIEVNQELRALENLLAAAPGVLNPHGRIAIISFHSLEDRMVKEAFRSWEDPCTCPREFPVCICGKTSMGKMTTRKPIEADAAESASNKRAHSAKLRVFERNENV